MPPRGGLPEDYEPSIRLERQEFLEERWNPRPGEHVTILAPTQNGKTTFAFDLLDYMKPPKHLPVMLVMKPRDPVVTKGIKDLEWRTIRDWPPKPSLRHRNAPGLALWPKHTFDPEVDDDHLRAVFRKCLLAKYQEGDTVILADETFGLIDELKLAKEISRIHTRGAGMGAAVWCLTQKPSHIGGWAYNNASHLFLGYDPDARNRDRFGEIGGIDPAIIRHEVINLQQYEWLYIQRSGRKRAIIEAE